MFNTKIKKWDEAVCEANTLLLIPIELRTQFYDQVLCKLMYVKLTDNFSAKLPQQFCFFLFSKIRKQKKIITNNKMQAMNMPRIYSKLNNLLA